MYKLLFGLFNAREGLPLKLYIYNMIHVPSLMSACVIHSYYMINISM